MSERPSHYRYAVEWHCTRVCPSTCDPEFLLGVDLQGMLGVLAEALLKPRRFSAL